uniref:Uncharacterized protein n=1 Tax=viral metagenome TaxID=1070528 RepID=A0A6C0CR63_9ZZZZ
MLFRGKSGKLYEIKKRDYLSEKEYNKAIMSIKFQISNSINTSYIAKEEILNIIKKEVSRGNR